MIAKRISAHILNRIIITIPALSLVWGISSLIFPKYFFLATDDSAYLIFVLYKYMIFLPTVFLDLIRYPHEFMAMMTVIEIILPALISLIIIEIISINLMKANIGMKIMGLKIISMKTQPLSLTQVIVRTIIKYFLLAFFPFVLLYIFLNKNKVTFYDKISCTKVVKI